MTIVTNYRNDKERYCKIRKITNRDIFYFNDLEEYWYKNAIVEVNMNDYDLKGIYDFSDLFGKCCALKKFSMVKEKSNSDEYDNKDIMSMYMMFEGGINLTSVDIRLNTINLCNVGYMFAQCFRLTDVNLELNTEHVLYMQRMFGDCINLKKIKLNFNTENVEDISEMFEDCEELYKVDLSSFTFDNVKNMSNLFKDCKKLRKVNMINLNRIEENKFREMFKDCDNLEYIIMDYNGGSVDGVKISSVDNMYYDFNSNMYISM